VAAEAGFVARPHFAAGMVFLDPDPARAAARERRARLLAAEGLRLDGWRTVPIDPRPAARRR
jgi:glutamate synthase (NADPH) large chain